MNEMNKKPEFVVAFMRLSVNVITNNESGRIADKTNILK